MKIQGLLEYLPPLGLIIAGIIMKVSVNKEIFGKMDKYWVYFIVLGLLLIVFKFIKF